MTRFFCCLALVFLGESVSVSRAQEPARPVDPSQPLPAQPVLPVPAQPAAPATSATAAASTNAATASASPVAISVIADSSLRSALQEILQAWADTLDTDPQVPLTLANAGTIRGKIEGGTVWDVVISADLDDMKALTDKGLLLANGQRSVARNTLIIYGRKALVKDDDLDWFDLVGSEWKKVSLGNPDLTASGRVAKRALDRHKLLDEEHKSIFVYAPTETAAVQIAQREQADAVFMYKTDLEYASVPGFDAVTLPTEDAPPIFYAAGIARLAKNPVLARAFLDYCVGDTSKAIWQKHGFETN